MKFENLDVATQYIIARMSDNEKYMIRMADPQGVHMALARWVNTEYISNNNYNFKEVVFNQLRKEDPSLIDIPDDSLRIHNDNVAGIIIDIIIEKLQK